MGAVTGLGVGVAQALVLARDRIRDAYWWAIAIPPAWALGWLGLLRDHDEREGAIRGLRRQRSARLRTADLAPPCIPPRTARTRFPASAGRFSSLTSARSRSTWSATSAVRRAGRSEFGLEARPHKCAPVVVRRVRIASDVSSGQARVLRTVQLLDASNRGVPSREDARWPTSPFVSGTDVRQSLQGFTPGRNPRVEYLCEIDVAEANATSWKTPEPLRRLLLRFLQRYQYRHRERMPVQQRQVERVDVTQFLATRPASSCNERLGGARWGWTSTPTTSCTPRSRTTSYGTCSSRSMPTRRRSRRSWRKRPDRRAHRCRPIARA